MISIIGIYLFISEISYPNSYLYDLLFTHSEDLLNLFTPSGLELAKLSALPAELLSEAEILSKKLTEQKKVRIDYTWSMDDLAEL